MTMKENAVRSDVATMQGPKVWVDCGEREKEKTVGNLRTPRIQTFLRPALPPPVPVLPEEPVSTPPSQATLSRLQGGFCHCSPRRENLVSLSLALSRRG